MKKILAIAVAAIITVALCVSASANYSLDRLFVNQNDRVVGDADDPTKATNPTAESYEINAGDKLYIIGWAFGAESNLKKIVYTVNGGDNVELPDLYRDRTDVATAFSVDASLGVHAGFGFDDAASGGMLELTGIDKLAAGTYDIEIKAIYNDDSEEVFNNPQSGLGTFKLTVKGEAPADTPADDTKAETPTTEQPEQPEQPSNPQTADASVIAIAAVACIALAGVVVAKKVR